VLDVKNLKPGQIIKYSAGFNNEPKIESLWILLEEEEHPESDILPNWRKDIESGERRTFKLYHLYDSRNSIDTNCNVSYCFGPHNSSSFTLEVK
jgi:hypothetical protein